MSEPWYVDVRDRTWDDLARWQRTAIIQWARSLGIDTSSAVRVQAGDGFVEVIGYMSDLDGRYRLDDDKENTIELEVYYVFCDELPDLEVWRD